MSAVEANTHARGDFHERLNRISSGDTLNTDEALVPAEAMRRFAKRKRSRTGQMLGNLFYPISLVLACGLGMLAVFASRWVRHVMVGLDNPEMDADIMLAMDFGMAAMVAFALRMMFRLESKAHMTAKTIGIAVMIATMHNGVHAYPELAAVIFSQEWVDQVTELTEPNSLLIRGVTVLM